MMSRTPLYIARFSETDPSEVEVLHTYEIAYGFLEVASELWQLAARPDRAKAFDDVITSAYELEPPHLDKARLSALRELLNGLEPALVGTLTDDKHLLSREKVEELRETTKTLDFNESFGADSREAVQHALVYVDHLRDILDKAMSKDACIFFD